MSQPAEPDIFPVPDTEGHFGAYGGLFAPESLMAAIEQLAKEYEAARNDPAFTSELADLLKNYAARPTLVTEAKRFGAQHAGGARVLLKREDLAHTGAHKINNAVGQGLLAQRMGKRRIIAETGAGQHGVATATVCALLGLECVVYMGEEDMHRQAVNVYRMRLLGAEVRAVTAGTRTLKDAISEAFRDWVTNIASTYYLIGSVVGPHPYPEIGRTFQAVISREARAQSLEVMGRLPDRVVACVGGGSNAIGSFTAFVDDASVALVGVEAGGRGRGLGENAATLETGRPGILHGAHSYVLQDEQGQISGTHSVSAGLDYPGVGPEHAFLKDSGRVSYVSVGDLDALDAFYLLTRSEGIMPALEPAHALAWVRANPHPGITLVTLSGRGDKDIQTVATASGHAEYVA